MRRGEMGDGRREVGGVARSAGECGKRMEGSRTLSGDSVTERTNICHFHFLYNDCEFRASVA